MRVWDAMEYEDEEEESVTNRLTATGDVDEAGTRALMQLD